MVESRRCFRARRGTTVLRVRKMVKRRCEECRIGSHANPDTFIGKTSLIQAPYPQVSLPFRKKRNKVAIKRDSPHSLISR